MWYCELLRVKGGEICTPNEISKYIYIYVYIHIYVCIYTQAKQNRRLEGLCPDKKSIWIRKCLPNQRYAVFIGEGFVSNAMNNLLARSDLSEKEKRNRVILI